MLNEVKHLAGGEQDARRRGNSYQSAVIREVVMLNEVKHLARHEQDARRRGNSYQSAVIREVVMLSDSEASGRA